MKTIKILTDLAPLLTKDKYSHIREGINSKANFCSSISPDR